MNTGVPLHTAVRHQSTNIGISAIPPILTAAIPKCPLCWMALMSALGVGSTINSDWMQPLAVILLITSVTALAIRARRRGGYGPFVIGLIAATAMYVFKFKLNYDLGAYMSATTLVGASIWNARQKRRVDVNTKCHC